MASLDPDTIARLLAGADKPKRTTTRRKKDIRDHDTWFDLEHDISSRCEITEHEVNVGNFTFLTTEDYEVALNRTRVVALVNGSLMCRYCFLSGAIPLDTGAGMP